MIQNIKEGLMTSNKQTNSINYNDKESLQKYIKYIESEKKSLEKEKQKLINKEKESVLLERQKAKERLEKEIEKFKEREKINIEKAVEKERQRIKRCLERGKDPFAEEKPKATKNSAVEKALEMAKIENAKQLALERQKAEEEKKRALERQRTEQKRDYSSRSTGSSRSSVDRKINNAQTQKRNLTPEEQRLEKERVRKANEEALKEF